MLVEDFYTADADANADADADANADAHAHADADYLVQSSTSMLLEMTMLDDGNAIGSNQCLCLPKAELKTKNSTKRQLCCRLVEILVFNSIH